MKRAVAFTQFCGFLLWAAGAQAAGKSDPTIDLVAPADPAEGSLLTLSGSGFGQQAGARVVAFVPPLPPDRERKDARGRPLKPLPPHPGRPLPIVEWRPGRIQVLLTDISPGDHHLAIWRDLAGGRESNEVPVKVRPVPPARAAGADGTPYPASLGLVHPELCSLGQDLHLYGEFRTVVRDGKFPAGLRVLLTPSAAVAAKRLPLPIPDKDKPHIPPQVLPLLESELHYARVRLPAAGLPPGEYYVSLYTMLERVADQQPKGEAPKVNMVRVPDERVSNAKRIVIRSTEPAEWEHTSSFPHGEAVPWKAVAAVPNVGDGRQLDVLGLHLGASEKGGVYLLSKQQLEDMKLYFAGGKAGPMPQGLIPLRFLDVVTSSDTRIRVEAQGLVEKGSVYAIVDKGFRRSSNFVLVTPMTSP